jgi:hypothetical protein
MAALLLIALAAGCGAKTENLPQENENTEPGNEVPTEEPNEPASGDQGDVNYTAGTMSEAYTAFNDFKYVVLNRITNSLSESESGAMASMELLGLPFMDLLLAPVAMMGMEEASVAAGLAFLNAADVDYKANGNDYTLSYKDTEGSVWSFTVKYNIDGKDHMQCTVKQQGADSLYFEYMKTSFGYAAQYYSFATDDSEASLYVISALDNYDGIIGVSATAGGPVTLSENMAPDFAKEFESWYSVQGDKGEGVSSDGSTFTFTALPPETQE